MLDIYGGLPQLVLVKVQLPRKYRTQLMVFCSEHDDFRSMFLLGFLTLLLAKSINFNCMNRADGFWHF